jgi:hypothetical protein
MQNKLSRAVSSKAASATIRPRQQGLETAPNQWENSMMRSHFPTSSLQPTTQRHDMSLKASHPGVRHLQPSTAYPTGVRETEKCPHKPSDAGDCGHSKPVYLLPSSVQKRGSGTYDGATSQMPGAIVVADHRSLASGAVGYASSSDVDSSSVVRRVVGFVALTSQYHQGTHAGSNQRKRSCRSSTSYPVRNCYNRKTSPRAPSSPCPDCFFRLLASNKSKIRASADFQAHESRSKERRRASAASEAARKDKRCCALSSVSP